MLTRPTALDGLLQPPSRLVVVEDLRPAFQNNVADDLGHGAEIVERVQRQHVVTTAERADTSHEP